MVDIKSAVQELHGFSSRELNKLVKNSENFTIQINHEDGASFQIDVERLASTLPLHLIAVLLSGKDDACLAHLLRGFRLLHSLSDLASRHARLEQVLLDDVKVSEQVLDLIFYALIILGCYQKDYHHGTCLPILHTALVACALHLLTVYISSQWQDVVHVLLAHPKVDIFMDVAFDAVHVDIKFLYSILLTVDDSDSFKTSSIPAAEGTVHYLLQQCEASLQFLMFMCQQKLFRDRLLKNKEMCRDGGILLLASTILKLDVPNCFRESVDIVAAISRLKGKILSILLQLCEAESISYLDEVASSSKSMLMAKSLAIEILDLLKSSFRNRPKEHGSSRSRGSPRGFVLLNAMRLADIFSDDSNFRSFLMANGIPALVEILAILHGQFLSSWCSVNVSDVEEDANLEYDPFTAAGVALDSLSNGFCTLLSSPVILNEINSASSGSFNGMPAITYAQHRTSCLVKILANLHCFVPNICEEEERNLFIKNFRQYMISENPDSFATSPLTDAASKAARVCENLGSLSVYAASLIPSLLNDDDVQLLSEFSKQLLELLPASFRNKVSLVKEESIADCKPGYAYTTTTSQSSNYCTRHEETQHTGVNLPTSSRIVGPSALEEDPSIKNSDANVKREVSEVSCLQDQDKIHVKNSIKEDPDLIADSGEFFKIEEFVKDGNFQDDDRLEILQSEEKQQRKRKRNIMNELQISLIEKVLMEEPEMQKNATLLQSWADKLSVQGPEVTPAQLKNWVNNRKAKLARAARPSRASEVDNAGVEKPLGVTSQGCDSAETSGEDYHTVPSTDFTQVRCNGPFEPGELVTLTDEKGKDVGKGKVFQIEGTWHGKSLEDSGIYIVDVTDLKTEKSKAVPHPSGAAGKTFEEAAERNGGVMRVAWDAIRLVKIT